MRNDLRGWLALTLWLGGTAAFVLAGEGGGTSKATPLRYACIERDEPRLLRIHVLRVDLTHPGVELAVAVSDDPDGDGPAEARLETPEKLAAAHHLVAAINANAFAALPDEEGRKENVWHLHKPVDIVSWAMEDGTEISAPKRQYWSFWIGEDGLAAVGNLKEARPARLAVAGFGGLLKGGAILPREGGKRHPRTAVGVADESRTAVLVVVDGRQEGFSLGMTERELAELMRELGCTDALNLDGGGSSALLATPSILEGKPPRSGESLRLVNRPSDRGLLGEVMSRPVPVLLGVRLREKGAEINGREKGGE